MNISFRRDRDCNNKAYTLRLGGLTCYISYDTIIAFRHRGRELRLDNEWGPTTGKHMRELGVKDFPIAESTREFETLLDQAFVEIVRDDVARVMTGQEVPA